MIRITEKRYVKIYLPEHHLANKRGFVRQHRLIWEEHNNASLLPWSDVHHVNGIKNDNRIENLEAMMHSTHSRMNGRPRKNEKRQCSICGSSKTSKSKMQSGGYYDQWYGNRDNGFICKRCNTRIMRHEKKCQ